MNLCTKNAVILDIVTEFSLGFENRSTNVALQKKLEFYYTFLLRLCKKLESETKSWSKILQI